MSQKGLAKLCNPNKLNAKGTKLDFCNECQYGKQVKSSYFYGVSRKSNVLDLVYSNVRSTPTKSMGGALILFLLLMIIQESSNFIYLNQRMNPLLHIKDFMHL